MAFKDSAAAVAHNIVAGDPVAQAIANEPHNQSFKNEDYLCSVANADRNLMIQGGGTITWNKNTGFLTFTSDLFIMFPNEVVSAGVGGAKLHTIDIGTRQINFATSGRIAAIKVSRTSDSSYAWNSIQVYASVALFESAMSSGALQTDRFDWIVLAQRIASPSPTGANDHVVLWDGTRVRHHDNTNNEYGQVENAGSTQSQYAQQSAHHSLRWRDNQDRNKFILGGGLLSWAGSGTGLSISGNLFFMHPGDIAGNTLSAEISGPTTLAAISDDQCYYITIDRTVFGGQTPAVSVGLYESTVRTSDDVIVFAVCWSGRLHLLDGTVLDSGSTMKLGGLAQGVRWIIHSPGDGNASYDLQNPPATYYTRPTGAVPTYITGGAELMVFVNGVRQAESLFLSGGAGNGDYQEASATPGVEASTITWEAGSIPQANHKVTIFVGQAVPNQGLAPILEAAEDDGTAIGEAQLAYKAQLREDAAVSVELATGVDAGMPYIQVGAGEYIMGPVRGLTVMGGATERGLKVYSQRPVVVYGTSTELHVSPGEIPLPVSATREEFIVCRNHQPDTVLIADRLVGDVGPAAWPALMYLYAQANGATMGAPYEIIYSSVAPRPAITTNLHWLAHPSDASLVYIGSVLANGTGTTVSGWVPFDRYGDTVHYRAGSIPSLGSVSHVGDGTTPKDTLDLSQYVPITAVAALLQVEFRLEVSNYVGAAGNTTTGVNVYSEESTSPVTWPASIAGDYDVQFLVTPYLVASLGGVYIHSFGPFWLPLNDQDGSGNPATPTAVLFLGPFCDSVESRVLGYTENTHGVYRHKRS